MGDGGIGVFCSSARGAIFAGHTRVERCRVRAGYYVRPPAPGVGESSQI